MDSIFARSPYFIEINETGQIETKLQLYIWNGTGPAPASPTKVLSKKIPSTSNPSTYYDVSPYILEYINHNVLQSVSGIDPANTDQYVNVEIKRFKKITTSFIEVGTTTSYLGFAGYGYFEQGSNPQLGNYHMTPDTYQYNPLGNSIGFLTFYSNAGYFVKYTNLISGASSIISLGSAGMKNVALVRTAFLNDGNKFEILDATLVPKWTAVMEPNHECKYNPVECNFVNKFGAWQSTFFFKVSKRNLSKTSSQFKMNPASWPFYNQLEPQVQNFNTNGRESITVNTGWVKESYSEVITQLMMSERILIDGLPYTLNTSATELYESINSKNINYQLQFDAAFDKLNSVN
jgi:hypothetical protein